MPTPRDYYIATIMGEDNRADVQGMQGIADVIANRALNYRDYGARSPSISDIVTARNGLEFNAWRPSDNSYDRTTRALQGIEAMRGAEVAQYRQAAEVVDNFLYNGAGRGISQGATFYQTPNAPNNYQRDSLWPRYGQIQIGNHIYTGAGLVPDRAQYEQQHPEFFTSQQAPAPQQDGFGVNVNYAGDQQPGDVDNLGRPYETGERYGFGNPGGLTGGIGNPNFGAGIAPYGNVGRFAFGTGVNVSTGVGNGTLTPGLSPYGPAPGDYAFGSDPKDGAPATGITGLGVNPADYGMQGGNPLTNLGMGTSNTLGPNVTAYTAQPGATQLPVGFDPQAYLAANPDVARAGADPVQHYQQYGMQEGRPLAPAGWASTQGPTGLSPTLGFDGSTAGTYSPSGLSPTLGAGTANPTLGFTGTTASPDKGGPSLSPTQGPAGLSPLLGGGTTAPTLGFDGSTAGPMVRPDLTPTLQPGTTVGTRGPDTTVQAWEPGGALNPNTTLPSQTVETQGPGALVGTFGPGTTVGTQGSGLLGTVGGFNGTLAPTLGPSTFDDGKGGVPGLSPLLGPGTLAPTLGPGPTVTAQEPTGLGAGFNPSGVGTAGGTMGLSPTGSASGTGGNFTGTGTAGGSAYFDPAAYLAANPDLARAGVDPFQHYEQYGYREGRPIDTQGHTLSQNFDPVAYFTRNPDVAAAGANAFDHYLHNGGREGREFTTGSSPYTFTGANAGGGLGAQATGFQGLNPLAGATQPSAQVGPYDFSGRDMSGGVGNGAFGLGGIGGNGGLGIGNPFGFSGANVGGGLGAMSQSFGSLYPVGGYAGSPAGGGIGSPYGFSGADVSGFSANTGGQEDFGSGEGLGPVTYESSGGFDPVSSQRAYFAHQENMNNQAIAAGRTPVQNATAITPNPWAVQLANSAPRLQPITPYTMNSGGAMVVNPGPVLSTSWAPLGTPGFGGFPAF